MNFRDYGNRTLMMRSTLRWASGSMMIGDVQDAQYLIRSLTGSFGLGEASIEASELV